ncbi:MAG: phage major capsid protein [bacterium]|nr:phage major capsid protein [bacterium]
MSRVKYLREQISAKQTELDNLHEKLETEQRARTEEEIKLWDGLTSEIRGFKKELEDAEAYQKEAKERASQEDLEVRKAAAAAGASSKGEEKELEKISKTYKITRAINLVGKPGGKLDGLEAEMDQEARKEGQDIKGNVGIPSSLFRLGKEKRDLTIATEGTDVRPLDLQGVVPILAPNPVVSELGATSFTGLVGNVQFPRHNGAATLAWEGETDANAETTPTFDKVEMAPSRVGGYIDISQTFIRQTTFDAEAWTRRELERVFALEIDETAINGSGSGSEPTGILGLSIGASDIGTNGGVPTYNAIKGNYSNVEGSDAMQGTLGALTTPEIKYKLMETPKQASGVEGNFIMNPGDSGLFGYRMLTSTQVPSNLTKGSGTNLHAFIFGNWAELIIGQWGGIDLLVDPYTQATSGLVRIVINGYFDINVLHAASFSASDDLALS